MTKDQKDRDRRYQRRLWIVFYVAWGGLMLTLLALFVLYLTR